MNPSRKFLGRIAWKSLGVLNSITLQNEAHKRQQPLNSLFLEAGQSFTPRLPELSLSYSPKHSGFKAFMVLLITPLCDEKRSMNSVNSMLLFLRLFYRLPIVQIGYIRTGNQINTR